MYYPLYLITIHFHWLYLLLGVVVNFVITRYIVFHESVSSPLKQFVRFVSVAIIGFFANLFMLDIFIRSLNFYPPVARIAAALSLFFASFFVHKFFSFSLSLRHHAAGASSETSNELSKQAGDFIRQERKTFNADKIEYKGLNDLVSYVDKTAERIIVTGLEKILPEAGFITEEQTKNKNSRPL